MVKRVGSRNSSIATRSKKNPSPPGIESCWRGRLTSALVRTRERIYAKLQANMMNQPPTGEGKKQSPRPGEPNKLN